MKEPHILLVSSNWQKIRKNLEQILNTSELAKIDAEIDRNAVGLFRLGEVHLAFAVGPAKVSWRQCISRLYYAAYAVSRSVRFKESGHYSTESTDHKRVQGLPVGFPDINRYSNQLAVLREDRNLSDYDHSAEEGDLLIPVSDAIVLVTEFVRDARSYLGGKGLSV